MTILKKEISYVEGIHPKHDPRQLFYFATLLAMRPGGGMYEELILRCDYQQARPTDPIRMCAFPEELVATQGG